MEIHVTVEPASVDEFQAVCAALGVKCIIVESLNTTSGDPWQFLTGCWVSADQVETKVKEIASKLEAEGFKVIRKKVETYLSSDVDGIYHEAHVSCMKIDEELVERYGLATSRKMNDQRVIGTLRRKGMEKEAFSALVDEITGQMDTVDVIRVHKETCVFDDNEALDDGWISTSPAS